MSNALTLSYAAAEELSNVKRASAWDSLSDAMSDTFMGAGMGVGMGVSSDRAMGLYSAAEQLRHYAGRVFTAVRPIAQAIAKQPIKVAEHVGVQKVKHRFATGLYFKSRGQVAERYVEHHWKARCKALEKGMPDHLKSKVEDLDVLETHPFLDALQEPNPIQVLWQLLNVTVAHMEVTGISHWWFMPKAKGQYDILPIPTSWITPIHKPTLFAAYRIQIPGAADFLEVPAELICPIGYPHPANPLGRFSPLQAMSRSVVADESVSEAQYKAFRNGIFPGLMIKIGRHPEVQGVSGSGGQRPFLTTGQRQEIMTWIRTGFRGVTRYDEPIIADGLIDDVTPVTRTNREMDFLKSGDMTKRRIDQGFGSSPSINGDTEVANNAAATAAENHFLNWTVNPKGELIGQCLTKWAMPLYNDGNQKLICYVEKARAESTEEQRNDEAFLVDIGCKSRNDVLADRGQPPIQGGDTAPVDSSKVLMPVVRVGEKGDIPAEEDNPLAKPKPQALPGPQNGGNQGGAAPPEATPAKPKPPKKPPKGDASDGKKDLGPFDWNLVQPSERAMLRRQARVIEQSIFLNQKDRKKYDPDQPRVPAGSPEGGEFGGGSGGVEPTQPKTEEKPSGEIKTGKPPKESEEFLGHWTGKKGRKEEFDDARKQGAQWVGGKKNDAIDALYKDTQSKLSDAGIKEMTLYRGIKLSAESQLAKDIKSGKVDLGSEIDVEGAKFASWSTSANSAGSFAEAGEHTGVVLERVTPASDIVSGYKIHKGVFVAGEKEVIARNPSKAKFVVKEIYE